MTKNTPALDRILGTSEAINRVRGVLRLLGPTNVWPLIWGPTGTGKELAAAALHELSRRADKAFIAVSCAEFEPGLALTQLCGSRVGAFTDARNRRGAFERAADGTLFLDEIGELPLDVQAKFLRILEARVFSPVGGEEAPIALQCRIVTATHKSLSDMVRAGTFREDLRQRLTQQTIRIPALRERLEDIPLLCRAFLESAAMENELAAASLSPRALSLLIRYPWPGNVRELRNVVTSLAIRCAGRSIDVQDTVERLGEDIGDLDDQKWIASMLKECGGNVTAAAGRMGICRQSLHRIMKRLGLEPGTGRGR